MKWDRQFCMLALLMLSACAPSARAIETAIAQTQAALGVAQAEAIQTAIAQTQAAAGPPQAEAIETAIAQTQAAAGTPDVLDMRLLSLLEAGATLNAMAIQGATFEEFRQQLAVAKGDYSLALSSQSLSHSIPAEVVTELNGAFTGWDLALSVWDAKLHGGAAPQAPDLGRYPELVEYVGLERLPFLSTAPGVVDPDRVHNMLLNLAMDHFGLAQDMVLEGMK